MSGITTGVGLFSGIDTASLIDQLLAIDARPRDLAKQRILQLQVEQSAYLDLNSKLGALQTAASAFRTQFIFDSMNAGSTNDSVLSATASKSAVPGTYSFLVDRLVSSQQLLSRGFADRDTTALNATSFTFESAQGRLDRDVALADLNDGAGVNRGKLKITQGSESATIDLSKAVTVNDVIDAINGADLDVTATASGDHFVLSGGSDFTVADVSGYDTATSLGIKGTSSGGTLTGTTVFELTSNTTLAQLNDGNGVFIGTDVGEQRYDFTVEVDTGGASKTKAFVNLGSVWETQDDELTETAGPVATMGGVVGRINDALAAAGLDADVSASLSGGRLVITDSSGRTIQINEKDGTSSTARNLGLTTGEDIAGGTVTGDRVLAGLNSTLVRNLNGGSGIAGDGTINFTSRDGTAFSVDVSGATTVHELADLINNDSSNGGRITASLNSVGDGLLITDTTGGPTNLIISGATADSLGISTELTGTDQDTVTGTNLQHKYLSMATRVDDLNNGAGIGTGEFRITDGNSVSFTVDIGSDTKTVYDLVKEINAQAGAQGANVQARINDKGDGIVIEEDPDNPDGGTAIIVEDVTGSVAGNLKIKGEAGGTGDDNYIDGSAEVTVDFEATDTLQDITDKINDTGAPVRATILDDGTGSNPYRLNLTAKETGTDGRFILDDNGFGLNMTTLNEGQDSLTFFGSTDPAKAVMLTSSTNTLDGVIPGVTLDLKAASEDPVTVNVGRDYDAIESGIQSFISAYNALVDRIGYVTRYDPETQAKGPLLGESTVSTLRATLASTALAKPIGVDDEFDRLTEVGITVGDGGKLSLDHDKLRAAMEEDFQAVADLFAARDLIPQDGETELDGLDGVYVRNTGGKDQFSRLGVIFQFEEMAKNYLDSVDGILTEKDKTYTDKIDLQKKRIDHFNELLDAKRQRLEAQFLAMEKALGSLQSQQSSLASLQQNLG